MTSSPSPESNSYDFGLGLDPSDPLNLLLHNSPSLGSPDMFVDDPSTSESSTAGSPPDWNHLEQLWASEAANPPKFPTDNTYTNYSGLGGFNFQDIIDPMLIDNSHSQYDAAFAPMVPFASLSKPTYPDDANGGSPFQFTFSPTTIGDLVKQRRLSDASSASSSVQTLSSIASVLSDSSAATSPIPVAATVSIPAQASPVASQLDESVQQLAQRIRQTTGVMLALPGGSLPEPAPQQQQHSPANSKLPIPRLPRPSKPASKLKRAPASGSSTPSSTESGSPEPSPDSTHLQQPQSLGPGQILSASGRPKTSHTTIERRYRTNLNARIQAIRSAVPALRILDPKASAIAGDVVDSQGLVDGVKAARKGSKATVLGKAVEYIKVLKKREGRLTREQDGLKALLSGLVGGPALLKEWENAWRERFGGAEKDAVDGEEEEDDEEEEEEKGGSGDDGERVRKKAKAVPVKKEKKDVAPMPTGEKRKRGRPRKIVPGAEVPVANTNSSAVVMQAYPSEQHRLQTQTQAQAQPGQYLLAVFALFSFANSPLTSSTPKAYQHRNEHHGTVLTHKVQSEHHVHHVVSSDWRDLLQVVHLVATILVLISIAAPWIPSPSVLSKALRRGVSSIKSSLSFSAPPAPKVKNLVAFDRAALLEALSPSARGTPSEQANLRESLGVSGGIGGLLSGLMRRPLVGGRRSKVGFEQKGLEQRAWVRLGELAVLDPSTSFVARIQTYTCMRAHISWFNASPADQATLALLLLPLARGRAEELWKRAASAPLIRAHERLALETLCIDAATSLLSTLPGSDDSAVRAKRGPLDVLAHALIQAKLRKHAAVMFVRAVSPHELSDCMDAGDDLKALVDVEREETSRAEGVEAARSFGGGLAQLGDLVERVALGKHVDPQSTVSGEGNETMDGSTAAILNALVLYRRIFPSALHSCVVGRRNLTASGTGTNGNVSIMLSPPPSPSRRNAKLRWALRTVLGEGVFESVGVGLSESVGAFGERKERDTCVDVEDVDRTESGSEESAVLGELLENARDKVVDLLVDFDRKGRVEI